MVGFSIPSSHPNLKTEGGESILGERNKEGEDREEDEEEKEEEEEKEGEEDNGVTRPCKTTAINSTADSGPLTAYSLSMLYVISLSQYSSNLIIIHVALLPFIPISARSSLYGLSLYSRGSSGV